MTTQYTPTLKLALPVTGELSGTWGDIVNDNITSMIEQAIAGLATINTWTANVHTLTTANGTTSESRCAMLVAATGSGGTAITGAGQIVCPAAAKLYVLQNNTSFAVTLKTSAGTGIAVAAGNTAFLFCDGTNVNACVTTIIDGRVTGNLTVDGNATINGNTTLGNATSDTVTVTARVASNVLPSADNTYDLGSAANAWKDLYIDGTATIATLNVTTIDTTNLEVTNIKAKDGTASITIADSTGAVSFANNVTLGDASTDTVQVNGYMGVGGAGSAATGLRVNSTALTGANQFGFISDITATSGATNNITGYYARINTAAATYTTVDVFNIQIRDVVKGSGHTITNQHGLYIADQTQGTNNYGITSLVSSGTNKWNIYASGTAANYFAGNVGIGTTSLVSSANLTLSGEGVGSSSGGGVLGFLRTSTTVTSGANFGSIFFSGVDTTGNAQTTLAYIRGQASGTHDPGDNPTDLVFGVTADGTETVYEAMRLNQAGGLITTPIAGGGTVFNEGGVDADFRVESDTNTHALFVQGSDGFVGIGTSTPGALLDVAASGGATIDIRNSATSSTTNDLVGALDFISSDNSSSQGGLPRGYIRTYIAESLGTGGYMTFGTAATGSGGIAERMRIDVSGNVGIGTTSPAKQLDLAASNTGITTGDPLNTLRFTDTDTTSAAGQPMGRIEWYSADSDGAGVKAYIQAQATDGSPDADIIFATNHVSGGGTAERMRIQYDGSVGIGTSSPGSRLEVLSASSASAIRVTAGVASTTTGTATLRLQSYNSGSGVVGSAEISNTAPAGGQSILTFSTSPSGNSPTERMRLDASGNLLVGTTSAIGTAQVQSASSSVDPFEGYRFSNNANGPALSLYKNRGATVGANAIVSSGDELGTIAFRGYDGAAYRAGAFITGSVDGTPGSSDMPGRLVFSTTADGSATPTERMRIDSAGNVGIGTSSPNTNLEISTTVDPILRLNNSTTAVTTGADIGEIQFYTNDASTNGTGVKAFVKTVAQAFGAAQGGADLVFGTAAYAVGNASEKMRLDKDGNLGLGVTPSAWNLGKAIEVGNVGNALWGAAASEIDVSQNAYYNSGWKYAATSFASRYEQNTGAHRWYVAPSGTANAAITFTQAMTLTAGGDVGIGTTSPATRLQVNAAAPIIRIEETTTGGSKRLDMGVTSAGVAFIGANQSAQDLVFQTVGSERARISSTGNFLINTTGNGSPGLGVSNGANISFPESTNNTSIATMFRQSSSADLVLGSGVRYSSTANAFASSTGGAWARTAITVGYGAIKFFTAAEATVTVGTDTTLTERMRITSTGIAVINDTAQQYSAQLYVNGAIAARNGGVDGTFADAFVAGYTSNYTEKNIIQTAVSSGGTGSGFRFKASDGGGSSATTTVLDLTRTQTIFYTGGAQTLIIDPNQRVQLGSSSALYSASLTIKSATNSYIITSSRVGGGTGTLGHIVFENDNGAVGTIQTNGSSTLYNTSSDYRLKNITGPITNSGAYIDSLEPCEGTWVADGSVFVGLVAHKTQEVSRTPVATGEKDGEVMQGMDYSSPEIIANLIAEVQSLRKRLAAANL